MTSELELQIDNGNSQTVVVEDNVASLTFWSEYFTDSYLDTEDNYSVESTVDLMGNPI